MCVVGFDITVDSQCIRAFAIDGDDVRIGTNRDVIGFVGDAARQPGDLNGASRGATGQALDDVI